MRVNEISIDLMADKHSSSAPTLSVMEKQRVVLRGLVVVAGDISDRRVVEGQKEVEELATGFQNVHRWGITFMRARSPAVTCLKSSFVNVDICCCCNAMHDNRGGGLFSSGGNERNPRAARRPSSKIFLIFVFSKQAAPSPPTLIMDVDSPVS